jgi:hypothetical protein
LDSALEGALYAVATITREQRLTIPLFYSILDQSKQQRTMHARCNEKKSMKRLAEGWGRRNHFWVKCLRMNSIAEMQGWMERIDCRGLNRESEKNPKRVESHPSKSEGWAATVERVVLVQSSTGAI